MRQLVEMAGGNARVRVDGFNGGSLPPRDVIRSIRIVRDTFPAENHCAGKRRRRHRHAGRHRPDPRRLFHAPARQRVQRQQPVRRCQGAGAHAELRRQPRRRDRAEQELVLAVYRRPQAVRHAGGDLHHARRQAVAAARPAAERRLERQRPVRLRADQGADAARRLFAQRVGAEQPRHRRFRSRRARLCQRYAQPAAARAGDRADRQERVPEYAPAAARLSQRLARRSSRRRPFASSTASRAAARR